MSSGETPCHGARTLVLLVNLGTPAAATTSAIRSFLRPFLSDRRVVDVPRMVWYPILYCFILPFRPSRLVHEYKSIWMGNMSPLLHYGGRLRLQVEHSCKRLMESRATGKHDSAAKDSVAVAFAVRYGKSNSVPAILKKAHEEHPFLATVIVLPLFPQYTSSTTACVFDEVFRFYLNPWRRRVPGLHFIRDYAEEPLYVAAVGNAILTTLSNYCDGTEDLTKVGERLSKLGDELVLILSYHSIPHRYHEEGDDYVSRCTATTTAVTAYLGKQLGYDVSSQVMQVYQSKFGKERWLEPFLDDALRALPLAPTTSDNCAKKQALAENLGRPDFATRRATTCFVATPGFASDCLETLHEVKEEGGEVFKENGGAFFAFVPCLNDSPSQTQALVSLVEKYL